jgi:hypothetical protein
VELIGMAKKASGWWVALVLFASVCACTEPPGSDGDAEGETGAGETEAGETEAGETEAGETGEGSSLCDPSAALPCGAGLVCCSDDPAALDLAMLDQLVTPGYQGGAGEGTPLFSGGNNPLSRWGNCVDVSDPPAPGTLDDIGAQGCPIPCNPTWVAQDVVQVCGASSQCCQTQPIEFEDCVLDSTIGQAGCWRPVTGNDIVGLGGIDATQWKDSEHATEQDPSGTSCMTFVAGIPQPILDDFGVDDDMVRVACFRRLGVANQRGYCTAVGTACAIDPSTPDACELRNEQELRTDCAELLP